MKEERVGRRRKEKEDRRGRLRDARGEKGAMEEEVQERDGREAFVGLLVVGRRILQIPVNRIQLRCYREYRWRLFPSVHPIYNARPYGARRRAPRAARTKDRTVSVYAYGRTND